MSRGQEASPSLEASRGLGVVEYVQNLLPDWLAILLALVTQLGDLWFLGLLLVVLYWRVPHQRVELATLGGVTLAGIGLYRTLKELFALPRPDTPLVAAEVLPGVIHPLYAATASATGYGFPSGHATSTSIVYFGLAGVLAIGSRRHRYAAAAALVVAVSFTRVALGVHYLVDVIVGVALGASFLVAARWSAWRASPEPPTVTFGLAIALSVAYLVASAGYFDAVLLLLVSVTGLVAWLVVVRRRPEPE